MMYYNQNFLFFLTAFIRSATLLFSLAFFEHEWAGTDDGRL